VARIPGRKLMSIAQAHQLDEFLELSSLYEALDVFARFLQG